jgi:hypothetical protein
MYIHTVLSRRFVYDTAFVRNNGVIAIVSKSLNLLTTRIVFKCFEVFHPMHFHILDIFSVTPTKCTIFIYYVSVPFSIFCWHNPSGRTVALGSTHRLTEMSTMLIPKGAKGGWCVGLTTLAMVMCRSSWNLGTSTSCNPQGLSRPVMGLLYLLPISPVTHRSDGDTVNLTSVFPNP